MHMHSEKIPGLCIRILSLPSIACLLSLPACKEIGPSIDLNPVDTSLLDTTYIESPVATPQDKMVLIEDFTGEECVNCPKSHDSITSLIQMYPGRVAAVALYNYPQDITEDLPLVTQDAEDLGNYLGPILGWPAGVVDRQPFGFGGTYPILYTQYQLYTEQELSLMPDCNISLDASYDASSRTVDVFVTVEYTAAVSAINHLSVSLCEDSVIAFQVTEGGTVDDYVQNHVLRTMCTPSAGVLLGEDNSAGRVYVKEFKTVLDAGWNPDHLDIVAFVHDYETSMKTVLQAGELKAPF